MLAKLIKYEWKASYKTLTAVNLTSAILTLLGCLFLRLAASSREEGILLSILFIVFYTLSLSAFNLVTQFYIYFRFYRNFYTAEGYLMHTLPVTPLQLLHSKLIVGYLWITLNSLLNLLALAALTWSSGLLELPNAYTELLILYRYTFGASPLQFSLLFLASMVISCFSTLMMGYLSILLGQLVEKYKLGAAIGFFIALYLGSQIIASLVSVFPSVLQALSGRLGYYGQFGLGFYGGIIGVVCLTQLLFGAAFYAICLFLMQRRVNLD